MCMVPTQAGSSKDLTITRDLVQLARVSSKSNELLERQRHPRLSFAKDASISARVSHVQLWLSHLWKPSIETEVNFGSQPETIETEVSFSSQPVANSSECTGECYPSQHAHGLADSMGQDNLAGCQLSTRWLNMAAEGQVLPVKSADAVQVPDDGHDKAGAMSAAASTVSPQTVRMVTAPTWVLERHHV